MHSITRARTRFALGLGLSCLIALFAASSALADTVNLTRFSRTVSGTAPSTATSVTVDLLRNTTDVNGNSVRQQVDSFTATPNASTHNWSGSFTTHAFSTAGDQVEIDYSPSSLNPNQVTIGGGNFLPTASGPSANAIGIPADDLDGEIEIASDGSSLNCLCYAFTTYSVTRNGTPQSTPSSQSANTPYSFSPAVTDNDDVTVTGTVTASGTTLNLTDNAPLVSPLPSGATSPALFYMNQPACAFYLDTSEAICQDLTPGTFTLTQMRGGGAVQSQTITVPAPAADATNYYGQTDSPSVGSAAFSSVAAGDQLVLKSGSHVLSTLTVNPLTVAWTRPLGDLENGADEAISGTCTAGQFFNSNLYSLREADLCSSGGQVPSPNNFPYASLSLYWDADAIGDTLGMLDDTSAGQTELDMPSLTENTIDGGDSIHTPFQVAALVHYNDPGSVAAVLDQAQPQRGEVPPPASNVSADPVTFSYAPLGSSTFATLGNINVAGGRALPAAPGAYDGRYMLTDARGDSTSFDTLFYVQGNATGPQGPPGVAPRGPAAPKCTARGSHGVRASVARAGAAKAKSHKKHKKGHKSPSVTLNCASPVSGARVAAWAIRGKNVVADGSGVVRHGKAKIALGKLRRGTYELVEVIDYRGLATEATHILRVK